MNRLFKYMAYPIVVGAALAGAKGMLSDSTLHANRPAYYQATQPVDARRYKEENFVDALAPSFDLANSNHKYFLENLEKIKGPVASTLHYISEVTGGIIPEELPLGVLYGESRGKDTTSYAGAIGPAQITIQGFRGIINYLKRSEWILNHPKRETLRREFGFDDEYLRRLEEGIPIIKTLLEDIVDDDLIDGNPGKMSYRSRLKRAYETVRNPEAALRVLSATFIQNAIQLARGSSQIPSYCDNPGLTRQSIQAYHSGLDNVLSGDLGKQARFYTSSTMDVMRRLGMIQEHPESG